MKNLTPREHILVLIGLTAASLGIGVVLSLFVFMPMMNQSMERTWTDAAPLVLNHDGTIASRLEDDKPVPFGAQVLYDSGNYNNAEQSSHMVSRVLVDVTVADGTTRTLNVGIRGTVDTDWVIDRYNEIVRSGSMEPLEGGDRASLYQFVIDHARYERTQDFQPLPEAEGIATGAMVDLTGSDEILTAFRSGIAAEDYRVPVTKEQKISYDHYCETVYFEITNIDAITEAIKENNPTIAFEDGPFEYTPSQTVETDEPCGIVNQVSSSNRPLYSKPTM